MRVQCGVPARSTRDEAYGQVPSQRDVELWGRRGRTWPPSQRPPDTTQVTSCGDEVGERSVEHVRHISNAVCASAHDSNRGVLTHEFTGRNFTEAYGVPDAIGDNSSRRACLAGLDVVEQVRTLCPESTSQCQHIAHNFFQPARDIPTPRKGDAREGRMR